MRGKTGAKLHEGMKDQALPGDSGARPSGGSVNDDAVRKGPAAPVKTIGPRNA